MEVMSAREAADRWGISQRRVAVLCSENRIANAQMLGNMWLIPINAEKPIDARSTRYNTTDEKTVKPFLKWAGGKGQLLKEIEKYYPFANGATKYAEPFVGGGAVLFDILSKYDLEQIYISDINAELINTYVSGGSKLNETARSYKTLALETDTIDGFTFVWFTDGKGWTSARNNLEETFDVMEHIYNIKDLENGIIKNVMI